MTWRASSEALFLYIVQNQRWRRKFIYGSYDPRARGVERKMSWRGHKPLPMGGYADEATEGRPLGGKRRKKRAYKARKSGSKLGNYGGLKLKPNSAYTKKHKF